MFGKIDSVLNQDVGVANSWIILFINVPEYATKKYEAQLKEKGNETMNTALSAHGSATAKNGETIVRVMTDEKGETTFFVTAMKQEQERQK